VRDASESNSLGFRKTVFFYPESTLRGGLQAAYRASPPADFSLAERVPNT
jgi:hypothetical protein